jgi:hypothetical protein
MSETYERVLGEYDALEAQAAELLDNAEADADPRLALTRNLRRAAKRHRAELERAVAEVREQVRAELVAERKLESAFRRLGVPDGPARALFEGVDTDDQTAMQARADELRGMGITWNGPPPPPPPPDPILAQTAAMQAAAGGGSIDNGDLFTRMKDMEANPEKYSDQQVQGAVQEFNRRVDAAARTNGAGVLG